MLDDGVAGITMTSNRIERVGEGISLSAVGNVVDNNTRCQILENMVSAKLFLTQARLDSLTVTDEQVKEQVNARLNQVMNSLGGEKETEEYFKKPIYKIKEDWTETFNEQLLIQQMQQKVYSDIPKLTPAEIKKKSAGLAIPASKEGTSFSSSWFPRARSTRIS